MQAPINNLPPRKCSSLTSAALLLGISAEVIEEFLPLMKLVYERKEQIKKETKDNPKSV